MHLVNVQGSMCLVLHIEKIAEDGKDYGFSTTMSILVVQYLDKNGMLENILCTDLDTYTLI
jgi:hypothetical protein